MATRARTAMKSICLSPALLHSSPEPDHIYIVDIPTSIEIAQGSLFNHKLISVPPISEPFLSLEPKSTRARLNVVPPTIDEQITQRILEISLENVTNVFEGPWCLPRTIVSDSESSKPTENVPSKRQKLSMDANDTGAPVTNLDTKPSTLSEPDRNASAETEEYKVKSDSGEFLAYLALQAPLPSRHAGSIRHHPLPQGLPHSFTKGKFFSDQQLKQWYNIDCDGVLALEFADDDAQGLSYADVFGETPPRVPRSTTGHYYISNSTTSKHTVVKFGPDAVPTILPPQTSTVVGDIPCTVEWFCHNAPAFDFVIMDPPWPNRSARGKRGYRTANRGTEIRQLLECLPLEEKLHENGFIAVWITHKKEFRDLAFEMFHRWGVHFVEEVTWLKITDEGKSICALNSTWKRPFETLLVARKGAPNQDIKRKTIIAVPDLHSRKPSAAVVKQVVTGTETGECLEIFARNLTKGWWSWGDEVLKFQDKSHWIRKDDGGDAESTEV